MQLLVIKLAPNHGKQGDQRKQHTTPDLQVAHQQARELTYKVSLRQLQDKQISEPICQNLKSLYRGLNSVQSHILSRWSQQHIALTRLCPWGSFQHGEDMQYTHSKKRVGSEEPLPGSSSQVNWQSCPLDYLLQQQ